MSSLTSNVAALAIIVSASSVLLYSALFLGRLRDRGMLGRLLARAVVDARSRRTVLLAISTIDAMFMFIGVGSVLIDLGVIPSGPGSLLVAAAFCVGSAILLFQIRLGIRDSVLSLENELDLRDSEPGVFDAMARANPPSPTTALPLYLAFPLEQSRLYTVQARDASEFRHP